MPRHLISDAHEWINEILTVPIYIRAKPQPRERAWNNQRGKKTLLKRHGVKSVGIEIMPPLVSNDNIGSNTFKLLEHFDTDSHWHSMMDCRGYYCSHLGHVQSVTKWVQRLYGCGRGHCCPERQWQTCIRHTSELLLCVDVRDLTWLVELDSTQTLWIRPGGVE